VSLDGWDDVLDFDYATPTESLRMMRLERDAKAELIGLRDSIDNIDASTIYLLAERFKCTGQVGLLKARHYLPVIDLEREKEQVARLRAIASSAGLDPEFAEKFLTFVIRAVVRNHEVAKKQT
jgi:chorismate mutase